MSLTTKRLQKVYKDAEIILFDKNSKFILMSDCHRGQGNTGDNFLPNQTLFFGALEYYYQNGFSYIELGDGDELWENREMEPIIQAHSDELWMMSRFYKDNRCRMLFGNHDMVKSRPAYRKKHYSVYYCESSRCFRPLFPGMSIAEGLVLQDRESGQQLFLVHGHQGDLLNDTLWRLARWLVRYVWRPLELIGFHSPTGAGRSHKRRDKIEKKLAAYAEANQIILIAGHTHRPMFSSPGKGYYFNDGSCVHPRCITGIEIENGMLSLVKWSVCVREDRSLYVCRQRLEDPVKIADFMKK